MKTKLFNTAIFLVLITTLLSATSWEEKNKIIASDRTEDNYFGNCVDVDGNYAIVGAYHKDNYTGAAYIFKENTSGNWIQVAKLTASDRAVDDYFGYSVSISGDFAMVGAYREDENALGDETVSNAGSVYIFKNDGSDNWSQVQKKIASNRSENNYYGYSVSVNGEYAVVGAYGYRSSRGLAYVLKKGTSDAWSEIQIIYSTDGSAYDCFGSSVSIDETTRAVIVGAENEDEDAENKNTLYSAGSAYIFNNDGSDSYSQTQKIVPDSSYREDHAGFGSSVSISGSYVVVGTPYESHTGASGTVYIFKNNGSGNWTQNSRITAGSDSDNNSFYGRSVAIEGDYVIIGAEGEGDDASGNNYKSSAGAVYFLKNDGSGNWTQENKIVASDRNSSDSFGCSVAISGEWIISGALEEDDDTLGNNLKANAGSAYLFTSETITEYYVATNGNDETCNGSSSSPWVTVQKAVNSFSDVSLANTVHVGNGVFTGAVSINRNFINLKISGNGAKNSIVQSATTTNGASESVFEIADAQTVTIEKITIQHGNSGSNGGGIANGTGTLTVTGCAFEDNEAVSKGGGIFNKGVATVTNSTFAGNKAVSCGGGYASDSPTSDKITNCTFTNNSGVNGANGGAIFFSSVGSSTYYVTNCTVANNSTGASAGEGGGLFVMGGTLFIKNTIIANNQKAGVDNDFYQDITTINDNGYNIVEVSSGYTFSAPGDLTGTNLTLNLSSTLEDNNAENGTQTLKTTSGSVAINGGNSTANGSTLVPTQDQREVNRNGTIDIGAYEYYDDNGSTPVELVLLTSKRVGNTILLNWETATEVNNYGFEIERKSVVENREWIKIGFVNGHGNSNSPNSYSFIDSDNLVENVQYRLKQIDFDGGFEYSEIIEIESNSAKEYKLSQNYPNPFNPSTTISYALPYDSKVKVEIFNILGQRVDMIANGIKSAGLHSTIWDAGPLASGIYIIRINATSVNSSSNFVKAIKTILMK